MPTHFNCECGSTVLNKNKARHMKTKRHMRYDDLYNFEKNPILPFAVAGRRMCETCDKIIGNSIFDEGRTHCTACGYRIQMEQYQKNPPDPDAWVKEQVKMFHASALHK